MFWSNRSSRSKDIQSRGDGPPKFWPSSPAHRGPRPSIWAAVDDDPVEEFSASGVRPFRGAARRRPPQGC
jgi:hypothetical protein